MLKNKSCSKDIEGKIIITSHAFCVYVIFLSRLLAVRWPFVYKRACELRKVVVSEVVMAISATVTWVVPLFLKVRMIWRLKNDCLSPLYRGKINKNQTHNLLSFTET